MFQSLPAGVVAVPPLGHGLRCNCTKGGACNDPAVVQTAPGVLFCGACALLDQKGAQALKAAQDRVAAFSAPNNPSGMTWGASGGPSNAVGVSGVGRGSANREPEKVACHSFSFLKGRAFEDPKEVKDGFTQAVADGLRGCAAILGECKCSTIDVER